MFFRFLNAALWFSHQNFNNVNLFYNKFSKPITEKLFLMS